MNNSMKQSGIDYYSKLKTELISYYSEAKKHIADLGLTEVIWEGIVKEGSKQTRIPDNLASLLLRLQDEKFRIIVVGTYNAGKSTVVNSILERKLLPTDHLPATDIVTEIHFSINEKVEIHFRDNAVVPLDKLKRTIKTPNFLPIFKPIWVKAKTYQSFRMK